MKKFFTGIVVAATMAWSMGIAAVLPVAAAAPVDGDIIKTATNSAVYYVSGGKKMLFVNRGTYSTWSNTIGDATDKFATLKVVSQAEFDALGFGGNITVRPGTNLVKFTDSSDVYAVGTGAKLNKLADSAAQTALYGTTGVVTLQSGFRANYYDNGNPVATLTATSKYPDGTVIKSGSDYYLVEGGNRRMITTDAFTANSLKESWARSVSDVSAYGSGTNVSGKEAWSAITGSSSTAPTAANLSVSVASTNPAAGTLVTGQVAADLAHFTISNSGASDVKITKVVLERIGVSADTTLSNVYLFKGAQRLTDSASVSTGKMTFTEYSAGIVTVPAMGSVTLSVRSDIATGSAGQTVGVKVVSVNDGALMASGNLHSIASATDLAAATSTVTISTSATTDPVNDFLVWGNQISVTQRDINLNRLALRMVGSINSSDISNFRLYVDGVLVATASALDANGYVTFAPASTVLKTGTREFKVFADITGGASRQFTFSLRGAYDIELVDSSYKVGIALGQTGSVWTGTTVTVNSITTNGVVIEKASDSPSGDVVDGSSDVVLAKFKATSYGEAVKAETLKFHVTSSDAAITSLRNARVLVDGQQVGSTATLQDGTSTVDTTNGTSFTVNYTFETGKTYNIELRADIYDNDGTNNVGANDTLTVTLVQGSSNAQGKTSGNMANVPAANRAGNAVTVKSGSIDVAKVSSYGTQTIVPPQTGYKIGSYVVNGNNSEEVSLNSLTLDLNTLSASYFTNVYLKYGTKETSRKATISATGNMWSVSETIPVGGSISVDVYASISSLWTTGSGSTTLAASGSTKVSGQTVTDSEVGQTFTQGSASISASAAAGNPSAKLLVAGVTEAVSAIEFRAVNDSYRLNYVVVTSSAAGAAGIAEVIVKDGTTEVGRVTWGGASNTIYFPTPVQVNAGAANAKTLTFYVKTAGVNSDNANSNVSLTLDSYNATPASGSTANNDTYLAGNAMYLFRSKPTISIASGDTLLTAGTKQLARITVSADAAGSVAWKKLNFTIATSGVYTLSGLVLKDSSNTTIGNTYYAADGTAASTTLSTEEKISGSKTYILYGNVGGTVSTGDSLAVSIANPSTSTTSIIAGTSFIWSDISNDSHTISTGDWWTDYLVKDLPTASVALTR